MTDRNAAFVGSIPPNYDRYLGPLFFHHYADDIVARLPVRPGMRVLETACGTGIVTERLAARIGASGSIVATDLNEAMFAHARGRLPAGSNVEWRQADATKLPFGDTEFDAVVCQFGAMFFPDRPAGFREAYRVLRPGGRFLFNVWDGFEHNALARIAHETAATFFPDDPPQFYLVPFGFHDPVTIRRLLEDAGFASTEWERVAKVGASPSAADAAIGLIEGNPIYGEIMERRPEALPDITAAVAAKIAAEIGDRPVLCNLRALVFQGQRASS